MFPIQIQFVDKFDDVFQEFQIYTTMETVSDLLKDLRKEAREKGLYLNYKMLGV